MTDIAADVHGPEGLAIDPRLTPKSYAPAFARLGRLHVPGFLTPAAASALHRALVEETSWSTVMQGGGALVDLTPVEHDRLTPAQRRARLPLSPGAIPDSTFDAVRLIGPAGQRTPRSAAYEGLIGFLNGPAFLDFIRALTGDPRPHHTDAQATRFRAGHHLNEHDDHDPRHQRLFAYVLNLTPRWRADWGGVLTFIDGDGHVAEGYTPTFNALNVFRVPQSHAVSAVAPFVDQARLSVTGWVHAGPS